MSIHNGFALGPIMNCSLFFLIEKIERSEYIILGERSEPRDGLNG